MQIHCGMHLEGCTRKASNHLFMLVKRGVPGACQLLRSLRSARVIKITAGNVNVDVSSLVCSLLCAFDISGCRG